MPFTTSHTAIVIPLKKLWPAYFSLSGLMAGAMSPDLLYFLTLTTVNRGFSHSWLGFMIFCIPSGIAFSIAFHTLFKKPFMNNLPFGLDKFFSGMALYEFRMDSVKKWTVLVISVAIGSLSHFFWDSFTHDHGVLAENFTVLQKQILLFNKPISVARIVQHISSIFGGLGLIIMVAKMKIIPEKIDKFVPRPAKHKIRYWLFGILFSIAFAVLTVLCFRYFLPYHPVSKYQIAGLSSWAGFFWYNAVISVYSKIH